MNKNEKIIKLTSNKTKQFSVILNNELVKLFKQACEKNNKKQTKLIEIFMLDYIDKNGLL